LIASRNGQPLPGRENHYLDCRVYNMAAAEKLLLDTLHDADWARLRAERCAPKDPDQGDLLAGGVKPTAADGAAQPTPKGESWVEPSKDWLG
jgi:hypothetical protein